ncbi:hypothetical protein HYX04_03690 [Candidatus Woesearchaeota archaeon]|nr:hypothetical protein [Candidatus Woesearchaeota archaeon]
MDTDFKQELKKYWWQFLLFAFSHPLVGLVAVWIVASIGLFKQRADVAEPTLLGIIVYTLLSLIIYTTMVYWKYRRMDSYKLTFDSFLQIHFKSQWIYLPGAYFTIAYIFSAFTALYVFLVIPIWIVLAIISKIIFQRELRKGEDKTNQVPTQKPSTANILYYITVAIVLLGIAVLLYWVKAP